MVAGGDLHQHVGQREPEEIQGQQQSRREPPRAEAEPEGPQGSQKDAVVEHVAQAHAELDEKRLPREAVSVAAELVAAEKGHQLGGEETLVVDAGGQALLQMGEHAPLRLGGRDALLAQIGEEQVHVLGAPLALRLLVEADVDVVVGDGRGLHAEPILHMPVPELPAEGIEQQQRGQTAEPGLPVPEAAAQEEQPEDECDQQDRRNGPHDVDQREQHAEQGADAQGRGERGARGEAPVDADQGVEEEQDQTGVQRLGKDQGAQHQLAGAGGPEQGREEGRVGIVQLIAQGVDQQTAQTGERDVHHRHREDGGAEEPDKDAQKAGRAEDVRVHGDIPGGGDLRPVGQGLGHLPVLQVVAEGLDPDDEHPEEVQHEAEQRREQGRFCLWHTQPQGPLPQQEEGGERPDEAGGQGEQIGMALQPLAQHEHERQREQGQQDAEHDSFEEDRGVFHGRFVPLIWYPIL